MFKKTTSAWKDAAGCLFYVTKYRLLGVTLYERRIDARLYDRHGSAISAL